MFRCSRAANSVVGGRVWPQIKLSQALMVLFVTCKNEEDPLKMKALEWSQHIYHCKSMQIFADAPQGQFTPHLKLVLLEIQTF